MYLSLQDRLDECHESFSALGIESLANILGSLPRMLFNGLPYSTALRLYLRAKFPFALVRIALNWLLSPPMDPVHNVAYRFHLNHALLFLGSEDCSFMAAPTRPFISTSFVAPCPLVSVHQRRFVCGCEKDDADTVSHLMNLNVLCGLVELDLNSEPRPATEEQKDMPRYRSITVIDGM